MTLRGTLVESLWPVQDLRSLIHLDVLSTNTADLSTIEKKQALMILRFADTRVSSLAPLIGIHGLRSIDISGTAISELRPLLYTDIFKEDFHFIPRNDWLEFSRDQEIRMALSAALDDPFVREAIEADLPDRQFSHLRTHLRSLPPWPDPLPPVVDIAQAEQQSPTRPKAVFRTLTMSAARSVLEQDYPIVRDRCQTVISMIDEGLASHAKRIPNKEVALSDHRQVEQALTYAKADMASIHDALPESFTDRPLTKAEIGRF